VSVVTDTITDGTGAAPSRGRYSFFAPGRSYEGATDVLGQWTDDIPAGTWQLLEVDDQQQQISTIYVPNLEGPFSVSGLGNRRPAAGVVIYGPNTAALHGMDAQLQTPTEQSLSTNTGLGIWPPGISIGWTAWDLVSGLLWMAGWGMKGNSASTTGIAYYLSNFDPRTGTVRHFSIPTDQGQVNTLGSTNITGGAMGADVAIATVDGTSWVCSWHPCPTTSSGRGASPEPAPIPP
jgi:hypothetical protein